MTASLDDLAAQAAGATWKWYGRIGGFDSNMHAPPIPLADWFKAHWQRHPTAAPGADPAFWGDCEGLPL